MAHNFEPRKNLYLRSGVIITPAQYHQISQIVSDLAQNVPAHIILLSDITGQVVMSLGAVEQANLTALASLVAGDMAASQEIARITGEYQEQQLILREGQTRHTLIFPIGSHLVLLMQIDRRTPLGWARLLIRKASRRISEMIAASTAEITKANTDPLLEEDLTDLFSDALDDLWMK